MKNMVKVETCSHQKISLVIKKYKQKIHTEWCVISQIHIAKN
jgi:hypothetical protein